MADVVQMFGHEEKPDIVAIQVRLRESERPDQGCCYIWSRLSLPPEASALNHF